MLKLEFDVWLL